MGSSIILELQAEAINSGSDITGLLRKAVLVATKLSLTDFKQWAQRELSGYGDDEVPIYRVIQGSPQAKNPFRGMIPIVFDDAECARTAATVSLRQAMPELEHLLKSSSSSGHSLVCPYPPETEQLLYESGGLQGPRLPLSIAIGPNQIHNAIEAVRTAILNWTLQLEKDGITGEGLTFTQKEKEAVKGKDYYNIEHFHGVIGNVTVGRDATFGDGNELGRLLEKAGIEKAKREEFCAIAEELKTTGGAKRAGAAKRALAWVAANSVVLGKVSSELRGWICQRT